MRAASGEPRRGQVPVELIAVSHMVISLVFMNTESRGVEDKLAC
ncbi:MAG: hypothetical protein SO435_09275 [Peptostreptococcus porci]|nr:hypothetical protein [Peptostreptococcus porci]